MKKILFLITAFVAFGLSANAQVFGDNFRLGLYLQPAASFYSTQNSDIETAGGGSFGFGLVADYALSDNYYIGSGVNFQYLRGDVSILDSTISAISTGEYRFGYLEIPVTLKLYTNEVGYMKYFGQIGLNFGLPLLRTRYDFYQGNELVFDNEKAADQVGVLNTALAVSAGAEYALTENASAFAAIWFNRGFTSVLRNKAFNNFNYSDKDNKVAGSYLGLRVGVLF